MKRERLWFGLLLVAVIGLTVLAWAIGVSANWPVVINETAVPPLAVLDSERVTGDEKYLPGSVSILCLNLLITSPCCAQTRARRCTATRALLAGQAFLRATGRKPAGD